MIFLSTYGIIFKKKKIIFYQLFFFQFIRETYRRKIKQTDIRNRSGERRMSYVTQHTDNEKTHRKFDSEIRNGRPPGGRIIFFRSVFGSSETVPSAENTDAGEITIHFTHYDAQDLEFYLNTDQAALAFTDATLTFQDSTMDAPVTMSYLSDDGSYVLYQNSEPVEEVNGTFSVSMVTEPGYTLDMIRFPSMLMDRPFPMAVPL